MYYELTVSGHGCENKTVQTVSLFLSDDVLALSMQELQVVSHHPLLAFVDHFGIGTWMQVLPTSHFFVFQTP